MKSHVARSTSRPEVDRCGAGLTDLDSWNPALYGFRDMFQLVSLFRMRRRMMLMLMMMVMVVMMMMDDG